jgi:hypothetical protein
MNARGRMLVARPTPDFRLGGQTMPKKNENRETVDRRGLMRFLGKGAATTAAVVAGSAGVVSTPAGAAETAADRVKKRYRETDHVKAFYRTNRY